MKRKQSPTNELTKAVIDYLNLKGNYVWRNNTTAIFDPIRKIYRSGVTKKGVADIVGLNAVGTHIEIEIKSKYERLSKEQKEHGMEVCEHGGIYLVIRSINELDGLWDDSDVSNIDTVYFIDRLDKEKVKPDKK